MKGGKTKCEDCGKPHALKASMRPAREGRENERREDESTLRTGASMRPAREGRENAALQGRPGDLEKLQ